MYIVIYVRHEQTVNAIYISPPHLQETSIDMDIASHLIPYQSNSRGGGQGGAVLVVVCLCGVIH